MPVQITINGENANQAIEEFAALSAAFAGQAAAPVTATVEDPKPRQQRKATAESKKEVKAAADEGKPIDVDAISKEIEEEQSGDGVEIPSVVDLRAKAQEVGKTAEKKKAIKVLLNKFESPSISDVPEDKRIAFMAELENLL
ncbi:MAG: hypothetical protein ACQEXX_15970 [Bacillota bacterium]